MKTLITIFFISITMIGVARNATGITQTVRGKVYDMDTRMPIAGATVVLVDSVNFKGTTTDGDGNFVLENVPLGRITLQVNYLGYEPKILTNIVVNSAKEVVLDIGLVESVTNLATVEIKAKNYLGEVNNEMATISARSFTVDETGRYAGSFNDPARMASGFAGVTGDMEGDNSISVRGNSPRGILWRLEGMEISNPNHFGSEGSTGGPISILNADLLDESEFYTGAFPAEFGNAISGVFDISLRKGNSEKFEFAAGISALGIDMTAEGPMGLGDGSSFLANYRYSSLGLLDNAGIVDFGGIPQYQDAAFKTYIPTQKFGTFSFYGMGGINQIDETQTDSTDKLVSKSTFNGGMGVVGLNHLMPVSTNTYFKTSVAVSGNKEESIGEFLDEQNNWYTDWRDDFNRMNTRISTQVYSKLSARHKLQAGVIFSNLGYSYQADYDYNDGEGLREVLSYDGEAQTLQTFVQWKIRPTENLDVNVGMHHMYFALNDNQSWEPRMGVKWGFAPNHFFNFGAGIHSNLEPLATYLVDYKQDGEAIPSVNRDLDMMKAAHLVIGHEYYPAPQWQIKTELYYQHLYNIPRGVGRYDHFYTVNQIDWFVDFPMTNDGLGRNYGVEFSAERFFDNGWFGLTTMSLYESQYQNEEGEWRSTHFNSNYTFNLIGGKEFNVGKERQNVLGFSTRVGYAGGRYYTPVDVEASRQQGRNVFDMDNYLGSRTPDVHFINLAVYYKINNTKTTQEIKLDIQNVTNAQANLRPWYNDATGEVVYTTQLGFLPNISYRIYF